MKKLVLYFLTGFFWAVASTCSDNFIYDEPEISIDTSIDIDSYLSEYLISPEWGTINFSINVPTAENAGFTIMKVPDWLQVNNLSGKFVDNIATVNCSANFRSDFSNIGFYKSTMVFEIEGKGKCPIIITYVNAGNPAIQTETDINLQYDESHAVLTIKNTEPGILFWGVIEKPEWLTINIWGGEIQMHDTLYAVGRYSEITLDLRYNSRDIPLSDLSGKIVITSNDKNQRKTVINVFFDFGNPSFACEINQLDFNLIETTMEMGIFNYEDGILKWTVESCPEWLSVSETEGLLMSYSCRYLIFTCNRDLLPYGQQSHTIYLKTNDENNPLYPITVSATGNM